MAIKTMKLIFTYHMDGQYDIGLYRLNGKDKFLVRYGLEDTVCNRDEAYKKLGAVIFHSLECQGKLD